MKSFVFLLSHNKNHRSKLHQLHTHWRKGFLLLPLLEVLGRFFSGKVNKVWHTLFCLSLPCISYCLQIWFSIYRYLVWCDTVWIYCEKQQIKMLTLLSPIFVADTKVNFVYNFAVPLHNCRNYVIILDVPIYL